MKGKGREFRRQQGGGRKKVGCRKLERIGVTLAINSYRQAAAELGAEAAEDPVGASGLVPPEQRE